MNIFMHRRALVAWLALLAGLDNSPAASVDPAGHQQFSDELTALLYAKENECSSSLGVSMAFSLLWPGSTGEGMEQIRDVMRYPDDTNMQLVWEDATQRMLDAASGQCTNEWDGVCYSSGPLLQIASSVWFDDGDTLHPDYESVVASYTEQTDFRADESPVVVNDWVNKSTNGLIDSIVPVDRPLFPPFVLLAINSIYLKARWQEQFSKSMLNLDSFYASASSDTEVSKAHFMNAVEYFDYSHEALGGYQVINLYFAESQMSMIFVLPTSDDSDAVTSTEVISTLDGLERTRVALSVPKFKFESKYSDDLKAALIQAGITEPFTEGSGALCGIFDDATGCENLIVSQVIQKTVIDVNEEGVEAAAVTMAGVGLTSAGPPPEVPVRMVLDHPFQFFIYDGAEGLMLFEGRLGATEVPETKPEFPLLEGVHSDGDFWSNAFYVDPVDPPIIKPDPATTAEPATADTACEVGPSAADPEPCGPDQFCQLDTGVCNTRSAIHEGTCRPRPEACSMIYMPVCGCDGTTHSNECVAHSKGASVSHEGECDKPGDPSLGTGMVACEVGDGTCGEGQFCQLDAGDCDGSSGTCQPKPDACYEMYAPVCGCDEETYDNDCFAQAAGASISQKGVCDAPIGTEMADPVTMETDPATTETDPATTETDPATAETDPATTGTDPATTDPTKASGSTASPPAEPSGPSASSPAGATGSSSSPPTKSPVASPAPPDSSEEPDDLDDIDDASSGNISANRRCYSLVVGLFLAFGLIFVS